MKKDLTFYEFVALIIPSVVLLFSVNFILTLQGNKSFFDFSNIGESVIFLCFSYALGHIIQGIGNIFENLLWKCYGGMPTKWLLKPNRFKERILDINMIEKIKEKIEKDYGSISNETDYGLIIYDKLFQKKLTERIDIFNGNYSLFRGLSITFIILFVYLIFDKNHEFALVCFICFFISLRRMIRFGKHYAKNIFRSYLNQQ
jgi:hypothetical protein